MIIKDNNDDNINDLYGCNNNNIIIIVVVVIIVMVIGY
jgi:hypothetical protein